MRKLEDEAELTLTRLFTGQPFRLDPDKQTVVATWLVMTSIVADYEDLNTVSTHHMQRKALFNNRKPPKQGWTVWIGYHPRARWTPTYTIAPFLYLRPEILAKRSSDLVTHYNSSISTQIIGEFFIQVTHAPKPFPLDKWHFPPLPEGGILRRIWPGGQYSLLWPPRPMSDFDVHVATNALRIYMIRSALTSRYPEYLPDYA